jgi:hypothetical protein
VRNTLAAEARERVEQGGAAARIEMGRDLVEERERRRPPAKGPTLEHPRRWLLLRGQGGQEPRAACLFRWALIIGPV